jgi:glycerol uptake facilitator-like aquaporin
VLEASLGRRIAAEFIGTAFLTLCIVGSGISAERLAPNDPGAVLLANALATGLVLLALILALGPVSGGQFNPAITLVSWLRGGLARSAALWYFVAQLAGATLGAIAANVAFGLPAVELATQTRSTGSLWASEVLATLGLVLVVFGVGRSGRFALVALAVGAYIGAAILFRSSTSFANPAATIARSLSDTFAGIEPASVPMFVLAELAGAILGLGIVRVLFGSPEKVASSASDDGGHEHRS